jgi:opacity protein-like surface antigen
MKKISAVLIISILLLTEVAHATWSIQGVYNSPVRTKVIYGTTIQSDTIASGLGIGAEYSDQLNELIDYAVGGTYEMSRNISKSSANGVDTVYGSPNPSIGQISLHGNLNFKVLNPLYILLGLNYSLPSYDKGSSASTLKLGSSMGMQIGLGYKVMDQITAEIRWRGAFATPTATGVTFNGGYELTDIQIALKYSL